jgi:hypothetical protein
MHYLLDFNNLYLYPLLGSALFSLKSFRLKWPAALKYFSIFLWVTVLGEVLAHAWKLGLHHTPYWNYSPHNHWIYGAFISVRQLFLLFYFHELLESSLIRKAIRWSVFPFVAFAAANYFFIQGPHQFNHYTLIVAHFVAVVLSVAFFKQLLTLTVPTNLGRSAETWIAMGVFLYHSGTLPTFIFMNYLNETNQALSTSMFRINDVLNILTYSFYIIAFLCKPHSRK